MTTLTLETLDEETRDAIEASHLEEGIILAYMDNAYRTDEDAVQDAEDNYLGSAWTGEEWAEEWADAIGLLSGIPEDLRNYFDYAAWYRDGCMSGDIYPLTTPDGMVHVFHT
jgi:antirestriction protein